jgi:DNA-binding CsgD family transcriptional regulator
VLTPVTLPQAPPVELVQSLFDLTPAEARVARGLASGKTVDDIASAGGTSANTVRTHVRGVLEKTGCNRQADIVALLTAISATDTPGLTRRHFKKIVKNLRASSILMRRRMRRPVNVPLIRNEPLGSNRIN